MSKFTYAKTMIKVGSGTLDLSSLSDVRAILIEDGGYSQDEILDEFLSDIPSGARIATQALANYDFGSSSTAIATADAVTFTSPPASRTVKGIVLYEDTGVEATSPLLSYDDEQDGLPVLTDGTDIFVVWDEYLFKVG